MGGYNIWLSEPLTVSAQRSRLLQEMSLEGDHPLPHTDCGVDFVKKISTNHFPISAAALSSRLLTSHLRVLTSRLCHMYLSPGKHIRELPPLLEWLEADNLYETSNIISCSNLNPKSRHAFPSSKSICSDLISSPGNDPRDVKARLKLKVWAQMVALVSASQFHTIN